MHMKKSSRTHERVMSHFCSGVACVMYQTRRRRKHLFRLENMLFFAATVLRIPITHMVLIKAREMVLELQLELSTFEVMLSFEVYEARELERECERGRQHARGEGVCVCV